MCRILIRKKKATSKSNRKEKQSLVTEVRKAVSNPASSLLAALCHVTLKRPVLPL